MQLYSIERRIACSCFAKGGATYLSNQGVLIITPKKKKDIYRVSATLNINKRGKRKHLDKFWPINWLKA